MKDLSELLTWLAGPGAIALVSWFVSWALIEVSAWQKLPGKVKSLLILFAAGLIGAGATFAIQTPELYEGFQPYAKTILAVIGAWLSTQVAYRARRVAPADPKEISGGEAPSRPGGKHA